MEESPIYYILCALFFIVIIGLVAWWTVLQWQECREMGFSIF